MARRAWPLALLALGSTAFLGPRKAREKDEEI